MTWLQQTLALSITSQKTFNNFIGYTNAETKDMLMFFLRNPNENLLMISGDSGVGKTHLLHAACHFYQEQGMDASFTSFTHPTDIEALLNKRLAGSLLCIDNIDLSPESPELEKLLFRLYNHVELEGCKMILGMNKNPIFTRKDLESRVSSMLSFKLLPYAPEEILNILLEHLQQSQSRMSPEICKMLIKEHSRSISKLISKINEIEEHACSLQKRVTLKMAKELIDADLHQLD